MHREFVELRHEYEAMAAQLAANSKQAEAAPMQAPQQLDPATQIAMRQEELAMMQEVMELRQKAAAAKQQHLEMQLQAANADQLRLRGMMSIRGGLGE
jgi:hypothetical protein